MSATPPFPAPPREDGAARLTIAIAVVVLGAFGVVLAGVRSPLFDLDRYAVTKELALFMTAFACAVVMLPRWRRIEPGVVDVLLLASLLWSAVSALLAANRWLALRAFGVSFAGIVLWFAVRTIVRRGGGDAVRIGVGAAAVLAAALGAAQAWGLELSFLASERPPGATFGNRNFLAHLLAISLPLVMVGALRAERVRIRVPLLAAVALLVCTTVLTRSRAAWLAVAASVSVMAMASFVAARLGTRAMAEDGVRPLDDVFRPQRRAAPRRVLPAALAIVAGISAAIVVPNRLEWRSESPYSETLTGIANYREGSGRGRLIQYENTVNLVRERPWFGTGPGNWFIHYPRVTTPGDPSFAGVEPIPTNPWPSSDWIAMLAERGVPGTALFVLAGLACAIVALRRVWSGDARDAGFGLIALGVLTATLVVGMFDAVLLLAAPTYFVATLLGSLVPATRPVRSHPIEGRAHRAATVAILGFALLLVVDAGAGVIAIRTAGDGRDRDRVERALRFDPGNHRLHLLLARRGACRLRLPHARAAARLLPYHSAPRDALRACGENPRAPD